MKAAARPREARARASRQLVVVGVSVLVAAGIVASLLAGTSSPTADTAPTSASTAPAPDRPTSGTASPNASVSGSQDKVLISSAPLPVRRTGAGLARGDDSIDTVEEFAGPPEEPTPAPGSRDGVRRGDSSTTRLEPYTWHDGDVTRRVWLEVDQAAIQEGAPGVREPAFPFPGGDVLQADGAALVFRTEASGAPMTLPGGVLLVLDPGWTAGRVARFFTDNEIPKIRISELGSLPNAYFVETEPGFPSLNLANALAGQEGVVLSSPNWLREVDTR